MNSLEIMLDQAKTLTKNGHKVYFVALEMNEYVHPITGEIVGLLKNGEPCIHKGCALHIKHPCEVCHRIETQGEAWAPIKNQRKI